MSIIKPKVIFQIVANALCSRRIVVYFGLHTCYNFIIVYNEIFLAKITINFHHKENPNKHTFLNSSLCHFLDLSVIHKASFILLSSQYFMCNRSITTNLAHSLYFSYKLGKSEHSVQVGQASS